MSTNFLAQILAQSDRLPSFRGNDSNQISGLTQIVPAQNSIGSIIVSIANFAIFVLAGISIPLGLIGLILAIIFSLQKSKHAKLWWIIFASCVGVILFCIVVFTLLSIYTSRQTVNILRQF